MGPRPGLLEQFRRAASEGPSVIARRDGESWEVRGVDPASAPEAANDSPPAGATASLFLEGLRQFYGEEIGRAVLRQVRLAQDGRAVEARAVLNALEMAAESRAAFAGLNFISRHALVASPPSPQFRVVCMALGILPERISEEDRARADSLFAQRFAERSDDDRRGVDLIEARLLMAEVLAEVLRKE